MLSHITGILFGSSEYAVSKVLVNYRPRVRELATVRIDATEEGEDQLAVIRMNVSTTLLVNTLATVDPNDWHMPSPPQQRDYDKAVLDNLRKSLEKLCRQPSWKSDKVLACDLPVGTSLPDWALR
jgi:hypothetical protein